MTSVNVAQLLTVCARASLVAQRYVMLDLVQLPEIEAKVTRAQGSSPAGSEAHPRTVLELSETDKAILVDSLHHAVRIDIKARGDEQHGEAADDLVTTADFVIQAVLMRALRESFPSLPFTVAGEENLPSGAVEDEAQECMAKHYKAISAMPYETELRAHVEAGDKSPADAGAAVVLHADSDETMRRRLGIFIDPIDGTNCFVGGCWQAPMTLVGITLDGVPIAGVMNRIFCYPLAGAYTPAEMEPQEKACAPGFSVVLNIPALASPFVVFDGVLMRAPVRLEPQPACTRETALAVCRSNAAQESFLRRLLEQLKPCSAVSARGAGHKQYHLLKKMLKGHHVPHGPITSADVFVCPPMAIKKWDCCAAHAFLYALGSDIFNQNGAPLRYPLTDTHGGIAAASEIAMLTDGLVAVTPHAMPEVARRLGWKLTSVQ
ncbi:hypothetical protein LSCM1_01607 [Leishmania martiniquensis]|uniref:3'(2'),5'-bisphosphate nucleotidase n=1 Tax=Leishmania martiniquensis TaxID=1580590 RepID=A0A836KCP8_9TRYP|nr:hypothetical protein LSCM1_01607 [Leishmania martiniquensis]